MFCVSLSGLHGRKHHVESGWPVDHAAERPFRSTGTREGDTCQQQEGGEIPLLISTLYHGSLTTFRPVFLNVLVFPFPFSFPFALRWCWHSVWRTCGPPVAPTGRSGT